MTNNLLLLAFLMFISGATYAGTCDCPYDIDSAGSLCGDRSAWSRSGGASPICYESDRANLRAQISSNKVIRLMKEYQAIKITNKTISDGSIWPSSDAKQKAFVALKEALISHAEFERLASTKLLVYFFTDFGASVGSTPCPDFLKQAEGATTSLTCNYFREEMVKTSVVYFRDAFTFAKLGIMVAKSEGDAEALRYFQEYEKAFLDAGISPSRSF